MPDAPFDRRAARNVFSTSGRAFEALEDRCTPSATPLTWDHAPIFGTSNSTSQIMDARVEALATPPGYVWSGWQDFGASATEMRIGANADGRLEAFALLSNGNLIHRWQIKPNGNWSNWQVLGTGLRQVSLGTNADGRLEIFAIGSDGSLQQRWQVKPNGGWSSWLRTPGSFKSVDVVTNKDGRLEAFLVGNDAAIYQRWQLVANGSWSAPVKWQGSYQKVAVIRNLDGRLETFALGNDGAIYQRWQNRVNGPWSNAVRLAGSFKDIGIDRNLDGRLELFALGANQNLYQRWQLTVNGNWSAFKQVASGLREIQLTRTSDGRLQLFGINTIGRVISRWQVSPGSRWGAWEDLGAGTALLRTAMSADGRLELFVRNSANRVMHRWQTLPTVSADYNHWNHSAVNVQNVWSRGITGRGVVIAVLDTGVQVNHPDLDANMWINPAELANNGIDDDQNGYIDDVRGWDFANQDNDPDDRGGHGTHVAGIIAAESNGTGATGLAPFATIMPLQVLRTDGTGSSFDIARGIRYAVDNGAHIINISIGGEYNNPTVSDAIRYAQARNVLIVAGAGNDGANAPLYPASYSRDFNNVISVGAHDRTGAEAGNSNNVGSSRAVQVDAPGVDIYSTTFLGTYRFLSGTSMAAPHVTAIAALVLSANPNISASELRAIVVRSSIHSIAGSDGRGGVDAKAAVDLALSGQYG